MIQKLMKTLPIETLSALLRYEEETGKLFWKLRDQRWFKSVAAAKMWNTRFAGTEALASTQKRGYLHGAIFGVHYLAHRVAYALFTGAWPSAEVDHINGDKIDNRPRNLRCVTGAENSQNLPLPRANKSGVIGVSWDRDRRKWTAHINQNGKNVSLGRFSDKEEAARARRTAERRLGYHPNHGRLPATARKEL